MATGLMPVNAPPARTTIVTPAPRIYRGAGAIHHRGGDHDVPVPPSHKKAETALRRYALTFPDAAEEFPWGERVIKVRDKIFVFLRVSEGTLRVGMKLPTSFEMALTLPYTEPTGYGLGRAGWITAKFTPRQKPDVDLLKGWIDQSYRAVAPKKLVKTLGEPETLR